MRLPPLELFPETFLRFLFNRFLWDTKSTQELSLCPRGGNWDTWEGVIPLILWMVTLDATQRPTKEEDKVLVPLLLRKRRRLLGPLREIVDH